jgi:methionyl aminopeptidase
MVACATAGCGAPGTMRCPTCAALGNVPDALCHFCSQACFKASWKAHKPVHAAGAAAAAAGAPRGMPLTADAQAARFAGFRYTGALRAAPVAMPMRRVPRRVGAPDYAVSARGIPRGEEAFNASSRELVPLDAAGVEGMRRVCRLGREVLDIAVRAARPGVTTEEIDAIVHAACVARDSYPSPLNYYGFPKACCTSVNEVICHGIPDGRPLEDGDILNIDITLFHGGYHGDLNETHVVGRGVSAEGKALIRSAHDAMWAAIDMVRPGVLFREFGGAVERVARSRGHSVVRSYCGHGIGRDLFHCPPNVPHYRKNKAVGVVREGLCWTLEPMLAAGEWRDETWPDHWTAVTADGKPSAQFEHTVVATRDGCEVLTARLPDSPKFWWEEEEEAAVAAAAAAE